jgi:hypothetical protein
VSDTDLIALSSIISLLAGFSSSLSEQLRQILQTTTTALEQIVIRRRKHAEKAAKRVKLHQQSQTEKIDGSDGPTGKGINDSQILPQGQIEGIVTMEALPVVIISNFSSRVDSHRQEIPELLTEWAANLVEKRVRY